MRQKKPCLVVTFAATADAMAMERYCMERNLPGRLIPVPREITAGCGLSWKAEPEQQAALEAALLENGMKWQEMHIIEI